MKNNIAAFRKEKGFSMQKLAELAGTTQQQIDRLEKSQRKLTAEWMSRLSVALGCRPAELAVFEGEEKKTVTAFAKVLGAIEAKFSNFIREFDVDEQYEISFKPAKKDFGKKFFALLVEGGAYKNYPENSELVFSLDVATPVTLQMAEDDNEFISGSKTSIHKFKIGGKLYEGQLVKSIRSE